MASDTRSVIVEPEDRVESRRGCSLNRNDRFRQRLRSPSPAAAGHCSYSRLSAMKENAIFKKYLDKNSKSATEAGSNHSQELERTEQPYRANRQVLDKCRELDNGVKLRPQRSDTDPCLKNRTCGSVQDVSSRLRRTETDPCIGRKVQSSIPPRAGLVRRSETERYRKTDPNNYASKSFTSQDMDSNSKLRNRALGNSGAHRRRTETDGHSETTGAIVKQRDARNEKNVDSVSAIRKMPSSSPSSSCEARRSNSDRSRERQAEVSRKSEEHEYRPEAVAVAPDDTPKTVGRTGASDNVPRFQKSLKTNAEKLIDTQGSDFESEKLTLGRSRSSQRIGGREERRQRYRRSVEFFSESKGMLTTEAIAGDTCSIASAREKVVSQKGAIASSQRDDSVGRSPVLGRTPVRCCSVDNLSSKMRQGEPDNSHTSQNDVQASKRPGARSHTPSFNEFKKRVRIPSFGEFRKQREITIDTGRVDKSDSATDRRSVGGTASSLVRCFSSPSLSASVARSGQRCNDSNNNDGKTTSKLRQSASFKDRSSCQLSDTFVSKGLRIKPSYIAAASDSVPDDEGAEDGSSDELENSLDDNIIIAESREDAESGILHSDDAPIVMDDGSCVKRMDKDGNFWIIVPQEEEESSTYRYCGRRSSMCEKSHRERKPPLPKTGRGDLATEQDMQKYVLRSTSDVSDLAHSSGRKRKERKERLYKSDPFSGADSLQEANEGKLFHATSYISMGNASSCNSVFSLDEMPEDMTDSESGRGIRRNRGSNVSACSTDSGVINQDTARDDTTRDSRFEESNDKLRKQSKRFSEHHRSSSVDHVTPIPENQTCVNVCSDCGKQEEDNTSSALCKKCESKKTERKRTLMEIVDTEGTYRRDLKILKEEFYLPIKSAGLLSADQLRGIFLNVDELLQVNYDFLQQLRDLLKTATVTDYSSEDTTTKMAEVFLKASSQFLAFENYCVNQANAASLLESYERENELLRVFLQVAQTENTRLRKMNLKSFLVIPIQRITKYPLLLSRLHKAIPVTHKGREDIRQATERIEDILEHINGKTQNGGQGSVKVRRRRTDAKNGSMLERFELVKVSQELLGWGRTDVSDVFVGKLHITQPTDHTWAMKKCKTLKFSQAFAVVLTQGKPSRKITTSNKRFYPRPTSVKQAAMILIREKNGRYSPIRDPLFLHQCVLAVDTDYPEVFELQEWNKECYVFKADTEEETTNWIHHLKQYWIDISLWRRRRNALANIMIKQSS